MILSVLKEYSLDELLNSIITAATKMQFAVAMWRLPNTTVSHLIVSFETRPIDKTRLLPPEKGFIVAPFLLDRVDDAVFIKEDIRVSFGNGLYNVEINSDADQKESMIFTDLLISILQSKNKTLSYHLKPFEERKISEDKDVFLAFVRKGIDTIARSDLKKIIAGRTYTVAIKNRVSLVDIYKSLIALYPNTFVSLVSDKKYGTWLGASPEILFRLDSNNMAYTVAMAGTKRNSKQCGCLENGCWSHKEFHEQALVTEFISAVFKKNGVNSYQAKGPIQYDVGNICHLKTDFKFIPDSEGNSKNDLNSLILGLHPTSAICGMPRHLAFDFLREHEHFDRDLYCGFLGSLNYNNEINLFVNIRCMQVLDNRIIIYAGAGITQDSNPEMEWEETNLKCAMIADAICGFTQ